MAKTYQEINAKIKQGEAVVVTAEEIVELVQENGPQKVAETVDVVTTGTFGPMCSSGAFLNFGHADPPIKMTKVTLNDVPAYGGIAAVDAYIGATELSLSATDYGGAHVIEELVSGQPVRLVAASSGTHCYPRIEINTVVTLQDLNEAYLFNPRNAYQNYAAAVNSNAETFYTYMGILQPNLGNVTYATAGCLSPLLNDPYYRTIGIGTRIFLGGAIGYVSWQGTQHSPSVSRAANGIPQSGAGSLAVIGDLKEMSPDYIRAASMPRYGVSLFVGIGIPIPVLDEKMVRYLAVSDADIPVPIVDYGIQRRQRPILGYTTYAQLQTGFVDIQGKSIPATPLCSRFKAREIAEKLKIAISQGEFFLQEPVASLPTTGLAKPLAVKEGDI